MTKKLLLLFAFNSVVLTGAFFSNEVSEVKGYDYSSTLNEGQLKGSEFKSKLCPNLTLSEAEKEYLDNNQFSLSYDLPISTAYEAGKFGNLYYIDVFDDENNGYVPTKVVSGNKVFNNIKKINNQSIISIPSSALASLEGAKIIFEKEITVSKEDANSILNAAFNKKHDEEEIRKAIDQYNAWTSYEQYLAAKKEYDIKNDKYQAYLIAKATYDVQKAQYDEYINSLNNYAELVKKYNDYVKELNFYNLNKAKNAEDYAQYQANIGYLNKHLDAMKVMTTKYGSVQTSMSTFIKGNAVTSVLPLKEDLVSILGVSSASVDMSGETTRNIRVILDEYAALTSDAARYSYYQTNYKNRIRPNFTKLTQCLESFFANTAVKNTLISEGKLEKYVLLVAELMYFTDLLNDGEVLSFAATYSGAKSGASNYYVLDANRKIDGKTYPEILGVVAPESSYSAQPSSLLYPETPVELLTEPTPVTNPSDIRPVKEPTEPTLVEAPGNEPSLVAKPDFAKPSSISEKDSELDALVSDDSLIYLPEFNEDKIIKVEKEQPILNVKNVAIYNDIDHNNAEKKFGNKYEFVYFDDQLPEKDQSISWLKDEDLEGAEKDIDYSLFQEAAKLQSFDIKWYLEGETTPYYESKGYLDDVPVAEVLPSVDPVDENNIHFIFEVDNYLMNAGNGDEELRALSAADSNEIAITVKMAKVRTYTVKFVNDNQVIETSYYKKDASASFNGQTPTKPESTSYIYTFDGWTVNGTSVDLSSYKIEKDTRFVAHYSLTKKYYVTWVTSKSNLTEVYFEGQTPNNASLDLSSIHDYNYYYDYVGFDKTIEPVGGDTDRITYTAIYSEGKSIIPNATIYKNSNELVTITVNNSINIINVSKFFEILSADNYLPSVTINFDNLSLSLGKSHIAFLSENNIKSIEVVRDTNDTKFKLIVLDNSEEAINSNLLPFAVLKNFKMPAKTHAFIENVEVNNIISYGENDIQLLVPFNTEIKLDRKFLLTFDQFSSCKFEYSNNEVNAGESFMLNAGVTCNVTCDGGDNINVYAINYSTGDIIEINDNEFTMPESDVKVFASSKTTVFTVYLKVDGVIYKSYEVNAGSMISLPTNVNKPSSNGVTYTFNGWVKEGTENEVALNYLVTDNAVLTATFKGNVVEEEEEVEKTSYSKTIGIGIIAAAVVAFIGASCAVGLKNKKSLISFER